MKTLDIIKWPEGFYTFRHLKGKEEFLSQGELSAQIHDLRKHDDFKVRIFHVRKVEVAG